MCVCVQACTCVCTHTPVHAHAFMCAHMHTCMLCMHVCTHTHVSMCAHVSTCPCARPHVHISVCMCMCAHKHMCVHLCACMYLCECICVCTCVCTCACESMHVCMRVCVCTCVHARVQWRWIRTFPELMRTSSQISRCPSQQNRRDEQRSCSLSPPRQLHTGWERRRERKLWKFFFSRIKIIGVSEKALQFTSSSKSPRWLLSFACWCQATQGRGRGLLQNCLSSLLEIPVNTEICPLRQSVHGQLVTILNIFTRTQLLWGMQHRETWSRRHWTDMNWFPRDQKKCPSDLTSCLWSCYHFGFLVLT